MPKITYIEPQGANHTIDVPAGMSVMQGAVNNSIDGILAECGGSCACATCHVYVDPAWLDKLEPMAETEDDMLECTASERRENSRLSCQIVVGEALDGLVVHLPESQR